MTHHRGVRPTLVATITSALVLVGTAACAPADPPPDEAAQALATGLSQGDLGAVPLAGTTGEAATAELRAAIERLEVLPTVTVDGVAVDAEDPELASAELTLTWDLDDQPEDWVVASVARLELVEDQWQAHWEPSLLAPDLRAGEVLEVRRTAAQRADVLGAGGEALVTELPVLRLGLDKTRVEATEVEDAARAIADVLELDPDGYAERALAAGERAFVEGLVVRTENPPVDVDAFTALPGSNAVPDVLPLAPTRTFARAVLGSAGPATAEIIEESQGAVVAGQTTGLSGLQRQYDAQLRGEPGITVLAVATDRDAERLLFSRPPVDGRPLVTSLDRRVQQAAEAALAEVGPPSGLVAIRPSSGEVLAVASGPGSEGYSTATLASVAPGSVFKVVSSLALVRAGLDPQSTVECPETITVDGRTFANVPGYPASATGSITLATAVAHSCNTAFIGSRDLAPASALAEAAASLGLGTGSDLGFPAFLGSVPVDVAGTDHAASMIGQGRLQASPLAMATVAASVAAGRTVTPWLVETSAPGGGTAGEVAAGAAGPPLTEAEAEQLRVLMRGVVAGGSAAFLADVPGPEVLAKTGTAQAGASDGLRNDAWMIAVQGDLAVAVLVEDGEAGATTAGPVLAEFLTAVQEG